jgi:Holliday junction resolvase RusA-like endonuclease
MSRLAFAGKSRKPFSVVKARGAFGLDCDARDERSIVNLCLPTPPSLNNLFVNNPNGGRFRSPNYEGWLNEAGWILAAQKPGRISGRFAIDVSITRPTRKCDLDNRLKAILDLLTKHRVIGDDFLCEKISLAWSDEGEGARVTLTKVSAP